jgi:hypothetical protein
VFRGRRSCIALIGALFVLSRIWYAGAGVTFDSAPRLFYWQIIDPLLLRKAPWQSIWYLRNQMPALNTMIALAMQISPDHPGRVLQPFYIAMGLGLSFGLFLLLDRLKVPRRLALAITAVCTVSPVVVLYENWLFYEYPLALLFCAAAFFLHRYAAEGNRTRDGLAFFAAIACIGLFRVIYHWIWFLTIAAFLVYALPVCRRRTARCAAVPGTVLLAVYLKSLLLFGVWTPGSDVYGAIAFTTLARGELSKYQVARLANKGIVSRVLLYDLDDLDHLTPLVPAPPPTGIPILDNRLKSTGVASLDSLWMVELCSHMREDGIRLLRYRPIGALNSIRDNIGRYFLPADIGWPFDGRADTNAVALKPVLERFDFATTGTVPGHQYAWLAYVSVPLLFGFGLLRTLRWVRRRSSEATELTIVFAFGNIAYLTTVIVFYDFTDQNRIVFEMFPLYTVLLGSCLSALRSEKNSHII